MRQLSSKLQQHLESGVTELSLFWTFTLKTGEVYGFTDADYDIEHDEVLYRSAIGIAPTTYKAEGDGSVSNMDFSGLVEKDLIDPAKILNGQFDNAEVRVFIAMRSDLNERIKLTRGTVGNFKVIDNKHFESEFRGFEQRLNSKFGDSYSYSCRATVFDSKCGLNADNHRASDFVGEIVSDIEFKPATLNHEPGYFDAGEITFTSGLNAGLKANVKRWSDGVIELVSNLPNQISVDDSFNILPGCPKTLNACKTKFGIDNHANFRGEPFIPGTKFYQSRVVPRQ